MTAKTSCSHLTTRNGRTVPSQASLYFVFMRSVFLQLRVSLFPRLLTHFGVLLLTTNYVTSQFRYIQELRSSILSQPLLDDHILYRGVDLSQREIDEMENLKHFFIPSFTSTSIERDRAYSKSALLIIKTPFCCKYACSITPELSKFYSTEKEVLLSCYSAYSLEKIEKVNGKTLITLWLDEFSSGLDRLAYKQQ